MTGILVTPTCVGMSVAMTIWWGIMCLQLTHSGSDSGKSGPPK